METSVQEVVSEASENSVEVETQSPEGNLSMAEFADSLLKKRTTPEEEPEGAEGEEEAAEEAAEESDPEATEVMEDDVEESAEPPPETSDVLSKFNVDLDSLSEEESTALAKQLNASAVKRFGKLTAQKKALAAENQALQEQAQQAQQAPPPASSPAFLSENALSGATNDQQLLQEVENLNSLIEWAEEGMEAMLREDAREVARATHAHERREADEQRVVHHCRAVQPRGSGCAQRCRLLTLRRPSRPAGQAPRVVRGAGEEVGERGDDEDGGLVARVTGQLLRHLRPELCPHGVYG